MVGYNTGNDGKYVSSEWHGFRQRARRNAHSIDEFGEIEIVEYDLDRFWFDRTVLKSNTDVVLEVEGAAGSGFDLKGVVRD